MNWQRLDEKWEKRKNLEAGAEVESGIRFEVVNWEVPGEAPLPVRVCQRPSVPQSKYCGAHETQKTSIVLHLTAGYGNFSGLMGSSDHSASVHFLLGRDGNAYQLVPTEFVAWHATWWNDNSVGIEIDNIGPLREKSGKLYTGYQGDSPYCEKSETGVFLEKKFGGTSYWATLNDAQYATLGRLLKALCNKHQIPQLILPEPDRYKAFNRAGNDRQRFKGVCTHLNIDPANRADIGPYLDWPKLIAAAGLVEGDCFNAGAQVPAAKPKPKLASEKPPEPQPVLPPKAPVNYAPLGWEEVEDKVCHDEYKLVGDYARGKGFIDPDLDVLLKHYCAEDGIDVAQTAPGNLPQWALAWQKNVAQKSDWDKGAQGRSGLAEAFYRRFFRDLCKGASEGYAESADEFFAELFKSNTNGHGQDFGDGKVWTPQPLPAANGGTTPQPPDPHPAAVDDGTPGRHFIPPRPADAQGGQAFFAAMGEAEGQDREDQIFKQLLAGNLPDFLRALVPVELTGKGHQGKVWVSPDVLAVGSDQDFVRTPLQPATAQKLADAFGCSLITKKLSDEIWKAAKVKLEPISQADWYPHTPDHHMQTNAFYLEHQKRVEEKRAGQPGLIAGLKKDLLLSIKLNASPQTGQLGKNAVVIYGWHHLDGKNIQPESDWHENTYVDYSHGIRLISQIMEVDGKPAPVADVLKSKELAPLLMVPLDILDFKFPAPPRYPGVPVQPRAGGPAQVISGSGGGSTQPAPDAGGNGSPQPDPKPAPGGGGATFQPGEGPRVPEPKSELHKRMLAAWHSARIEIARGVAKHGEGKKWTTGPNSGPIIDEYQHAAYATPGPGMPWCGIFQAWNYRKAGVAADEKIDKKFQVTNVTAARVFVFWSTLRLTYYWDRVKSPHLKFPWSKFGSWKKDDCIGWLKDNFNTFASDLPRPGDILVVDTYKPEAHVAMVGGYDPDTFQLVTYEGNCGDKAAAHGWDLSAPTKQGFFRLNHIGRFPEEDFTQDPAVPPDGPSPDPHLYGATNASGRYGS